MKQKQLGQTDIMLAQIGLGCMGLSEFYGPPTEEASAIKLLHEAIELGVNDYLGKPYQDSQLLDAIRRQLEEKGIELP